MAKANVEDTVRVRPNSIDENRLVLKELQNRKEVDARSQAELTQIFNNVNDKLKEHSKRQQVSSSLSDNKQEKGSKEVLYGPIPDFPSGTWWGIRMDCSRDNVHEPFNENIHNGPYGVVSICTSHLNTYNDVDLGDILTFTSGEYNSTDRFKDPLILSYKNKVPIRLVRSYCLSNNYAPKTGYRYDGLYSVIHYWIGLSSTTKHYKFVLTRVLNQEPAPWALKDSNSLNIGKLKKSISPRLTRSHSNIQAQEPKCTNLEYNDVQKESKVASISSIVSRQVFKKFIPGSPDSSPKSVSSTDSLGAISYPISCPTKLCSTNLSIRTNLYDSSYKIQDTKKITPITFCRIYKSNQSQSSGKSSEEEMEKVSTDTSDTEIMDKIPVISSTSDECTERKIKKVTWADSCSSTSSGIEKSLPTTGNGFQYSGSDVVDGFSPTSLNKSNVLKFNNIMEYSPISTSSQPNALSSSNTQNSQHIVHSKSNLPRKSQSPEENLFKLCENIHETEHLDEPSSSIDSLAPDKLVSVIVKEKYHPMAKLLIGNMIGLENQESSIISAYNTLTSKVNQDDSKKSKENKLRNKFYIRNKSRKNAVLKKQRREIANLIIDAKFDTATRGLRNRKYRNIRNKRKEDQSIVISKSSRKRISKSEMPKPQRKIVSARKIQSRNLKKEIRGPTTVREIQSKKPIKRKIEDTITIKRPKMVTSWTQCTLLVAPSVDQSCQVDDSSVETIIPESEIKVEYVDLEEVKTEPCDAESINETPSEPDTNYTERRYFGNSAFAAVNTPNSSIRIARLRSIGFRPIGSSPMEDEDSNQGSTKPDVDEEYNKYTSEENNIVGYMDEQLHFEDIEDEEMMNTTQKECSHKPLELLTEQDFDKPWHGWRKVSTNGQVYWTGY